MTSHPIRPLACAALAAGTLVATALSATAAPAAGSSFAGVPSAGAAVRSALHALATPSARSGVAVCDADGFVKAVHASGGEDRPVTYGKGALATAGPAYGAARLVLLGYSCGAPGSGDGGTHAIVTLAAVSANGRMAVLARNAGEGTTLYPELVSGLFFLARGAVGATTLSVGENDGQCCPKTLVGETLVRRGARLVVTSQEADN